MSNLKFDGEAARIQGMLAQCHDAVLRRHRVMQALNLKAGERAMEFGCGAGLYAYEAAQFVGSSGDIRAIDISEDQVAMAQSRCKEFEHVTVQTADLAELPFKADRYDAVWGVQVLEYVPDLGSALSEVHRVLRPGGRLLVLSTNWGSCVWHSEVPGRMRRILEAFDAHCPFPNLSSVLPQHLHVNGFKVSRQIPMPVLNTTYGDTSLSRWLAPLISTYVAAQGLILDAEAQAWIAEFDDLEKRGAYWFASLPMITEAVKLSS
jgi:arsenite methyltransferase